MIPYLHWELAAPYADELLGVNEIQPPRHRMFNSITWGASGRRRYCAFTTVNSYVVAPQRSLVAQLTGAPRAWEVQDVERSVTAVPDPSDSEHGRLVQLDAQSAMQASGRICVTGFAFIGSGCLVLREPLALRRTGMRPCLVYKPTNSCPRHCTPSYKLPTGQ
jgi:hypothetical protein